MDDPASSRDLLAVQCLFPDCQASVSTLSTASTNDLHSPASYKVLEIIAPLNSELGLILQFGDRLPHNVCEQVNQSRTSMSTAILCLAEWKPVLCYFEQSNTQRPNIGGDCIRKTLDSFRLRDINKKSMTKENVHTYRHVVRGPNECVGISLRANKFAGDTKVAQFHLTTSSQENV